MNRKNFILGVFGVLFAIVLISNVINMPPRELTTAAVTPAPKDARSVTARDLIDETQRILDNNFPNGNWIDYDAENAGVRIYLYSPGDAEMRVRRRGRNGKYVYYWTEKRRISDTARVEIEKRISKEEYAAFLHQADPERRPIHKTRYCLIENNRYFEIDIYPEWEKQAVMEVELRDENEVIEEIDFPGNIHVIREVTNDYAYQNYSLALFMPEED